MAPGSSGVLVLDAASGLLTLMSSFKVSSFILIKLLPSAGLADIELVAPGSSEVLVLDAASGLVTLITISS